MVTVGVHFVTHTGQHNAFLDNHIKGHCYDNNKDTQHKQRQCIELSEMSMRARKGSES